MIDADALKKEFPKDSDWEYPVNTNEYVCEKIDEQPTIEERKNGGWLRYGEDGYPNNEDTVFWQCDQCLEQYTGRAKRIPNFCPNCGCRMGGESDEVD